MLDEVLSLCRSLCLAARTPSARSQQSPGQKRIQLTCVVGGCSCTYHHLVHLASTRLVQRPGQMRLSYISAWPCQHHGIITQCPVVFVDGNKEVLKNKDMQEPIVACYLDASNESWFNFLWHAFLFIFGMPLINTNAQVMRKLLLFGAIWTFCK